VVYCAGAKNVYKSDASVKRSIDSGKTWQIITPNNRTNNGIDWGDGANEVFAIRVNPVTRELWTAGSCYGIWKEEGIKSLSVTLTNPVKNGFYRAGTDLMLKATATMLNDEITKVEFFNGSGKVGESTNAPYQFNWQKVESGNWQLHAKVTDAKGDTAVSYVVPISVVPNIAPEISISSPDNNSIFASASTIPFTVNTADKDGTIAKVEYFNGTVKIGESLISPFGFEWKNVTTGEYSIKATASDNEGLSTTSLPFSVTVSGPDGQLTYTENFDDNLAQNWKSNSGTWVAEGKQYHHSSTDGIDISVYDGTTFYNFTYTARIKPDWGNIFGLVFNYVDNKNYYLIEFGNDKSAKLTEIKNGSGKTLASGSYTGGGQGVYSSVKIINNGKSTSVDVNGKNVFNGIATTAFRYGKIGLYAWWQPVWYDDIEVNAESKGFPVGTETLANDESGMKCYPNPLVNGNLTIELAKSEKNIRLEIFNLEGQLVWSQLKKEATVLNVSANVFPSYGLFFIKLNSDKNYFQTKILKSVN